MNTTICDEPTSSLADMLGPTLLIFCVDLWGFAKDSVYEDRVIFDRHGPVKWCLSELLPALTANLRTADEFDAWWNDEQQIHEACPWQ